MPEWWNIEMRPRPRTRPGGSLLTSSTPCSLCWTRVLLEPSGFLLQRACLALCFLFLFLGFYLFFTHFLFSTCLSEPWLFLFMRYFRCFHVECYLIFRAIFTRMCLLCGLSWPSDFASCLSAIEEVVPGSPRGLCIRAIGDWTCKSRRVGPASFGARAFKRPSSPG